MNYLFNGLTCHIKNSSPSQFFLYFYSLLPKDTFQLQLLFRYFTVCVQNLDTYYSSWRKAHQSEREKENESPGGNSLYRCELIVVLFVLLVRLSFLFVLLARLSFLFVLYVRVYCLFLLLLVSYVGSPFIHEAISMKPLVQTNNVLWICLCGCVCVCFSVCVDLSVSKRV